MADRYISRDWLLKVLADYKNIGTWNLDVCDADTVLRVLEVLENKVKGAPGIGPRKLGNKLLAAKNVALEVHLNLRSTACIAQPRMIFAATASIRQIREVAGMRKPKDAPEMRKLLIDYIDALLLGGIPKLALDAPAEEQSVEESAAEMASAVKRMGFTGRSEFQLMLEGISILYSEHRETATERCYALFWRIQQMQSVQGQLERCFEMLRMLNMATGKANAGLFTSPFAMACV